MIVFVFFCITWCFAFYLVDFLLRESYKHFNIFKFIFYENRSIHSHIPKAGVATEGQRDKETWDRVSLPTLPSLSLQKTMPDPAPRLTVLGHATHMAPAHTANAHTANAHTVNAHIDSSYCIHCFRTTMPSEDPTS